MPATQERSAGVVIYRRSAHSPELFLLLDYGRYWDYAKGHVEPGEDDPTAARREVLEETGIAELELDPTFRQEIAYFFRGRKGLVRKTVMFFLGRTPTEHVTISDEHIGYAWLDYDAAHARLNYASARRVLQAAKRHLEAAPGSSPGDLTAR